MSRGIGAPKYVGAESWHDHLGNRRDQSNDMPPTWSDWTNTTLLAPFDAKTFRFALILISMVMEAVGSALIGIFTALAVHAALANVGLGGTLVNGVVVGIASGLSYYIASGLVLSPQANPSDEPNEMRHHFFWTITLANVLLRRTGIVVACFYWAAQLAGSLIAAAFLIAFEVDNVITDSSSLGISWATQVIGAWFVVSVYLFKSYLGGTIKDEENQERQKNTDMHVALSIGIFTALSFQFGIFSIDGTQWLPGHLASIFITGSTPVTEPNNPFWFFSCWIGSIAASALYMIFLVIYGCSFGWFKGRTGTKRWVQGMNLPNAFKASPPSAPRGSTNQVEATGSQYDRRRQ